MAGRSTVRISSSNGGRPTGSRPSLELEDAVRRERADKGAAAVFDEDEELGVAATSLRPLSFPTRAPLVRSLLACNNLAAMASLGPGSPMLNQRS
jgi:hypothetical protein